MRTPLDWQSAGLAAGTPFAAAHTLAQTGPFRFSTLDARIAAHPFTHGASYEIGKIKLISSYHCSRYNTNTGVLTTEMFESVVGKAKKAAGL